MLQLYHQESIYLVLVGVEVWTTGDMINVTETDKSGTLSEFCEYRTNNINPYHNNDNAQLFTCVGVLIHCCPVSYLKKVSGEQNIRPTQSM